MTDAAGFSRRLLTRILGVEENELPPVAAGMLMFFLLFARTFPVVAIQEVKEMIPFPRKRGAGRGGH